MLATSYHQLSASTRTSWTRPPTQTKFVPLICSSWIAATKKGTYVGSLPPKGHERQVPRQHPARRNLLCRPPNGAFPIFSLFIYNTSLTFLCFHLAACRRSHPGRTHRLRNGRQEVRSVLEDYRRTGASQLELLLDPLFDNSLTLPLCISLEDRLVWSSQAGPSRHLGGADRCWLRVGSRLRKVSPNGQVVRRY